MKAKTVTYKCIKHISEDCIPEQEEDTVEDPPYYKECKNCYAKMCEEEREDINHLQEVICHF